VTAFIAGARFVAVIGRVPGPIAWLGGSTWQCPVLRRSRAKNLRNWRSARLALDVEAETSAPPRMEEFAQDDSDVYLARLEEFAARGEVDAMEDLLYDMVDEGEMPGVAHYNVLIRGCAPVKNFDKAERWLFRMKALAVEPDIHTFNALIGIVATNGDLEGAERWLKQIQDAGLQPSLETFRLLLNAARVGRQTMAMEAWIERMMEGGITPDVACINEVIGAFAEAKRMRKVEEWLAIMQQTLRITPDVESYNLAIGGYAETGDLSQAERLMQEMLDAGLQPDARSYTLLTGDGSYGRDLAVVKTWSERLKTSGVDVDASSYRAVIGAWAAAGHADEAEDWFARMVKEGKATTEALALIVDTLVLSGGAEGFETAQAWVDEVRTAGVEPTPAVYAALASADVFRGDFEQVEARLQQMEAEGVEMDADSLAALLLSYANAEPPQSQLAEQVFKQQMLRGRIRASRQLMEALRAAVGGSRCLSLRRELKLFTSPQGEAAAPGPGPRRGLNTAVDELYGKDGKPLSYARKQWAHLRPTSALPEKPFQWE